MNQPPTSLILFSAPATYNCIIFDPECWPNAGHWPAATCGDKWKGKCGVEGGELFISPQPILTLVVTVHQHSNQSLAVFVTTTKFCTPSCSLQLQTSSTSSEFSYFTEHNRSEGAAIKHKKDESELFITQPISSNTFLNLYLQCLFRSVSSWLQIKRTYQVKVWSKTVIG